MKVLHVISSIDPRDGGTTSTFLKLTAAQQRAGLQVTAVASYRANDNLAGADEMKAAGVSVELLGPGKGKLVRVPGMTGRIRDLVAQADVVHIHAIWEEIQHRAAVEARRAGKPYIMLPQGMLDPWSLSQNALLKKLYMALRLRRDLNSAAAIHVTAVPERDLIRQLNLAPPFVIEPLGVDLREFKELPPKGWLRQRYPQIGDRPIVLFLSRLHLKKGLDLLIPAFARAQTNNAVLVLAGPGEADYVESLHADARRHNIEDRVIFTGMLHGNERVKAYVDADLFALPSYGENFGIVVPEALAAGCPVLISDKVNIFDQVAEARVGGIVQPNVESVTQGLTKWLNDVELRKSAAALARDFVRSRFDWEEIGKHWVKHYERLRK